MKYDARAAQAVHNNAVWCDTVCRAHARPGEFRRGMWLNRYETPPFYPNAVTLSGPDDSATQLEHVRELLEAGIHGEWAVKDSFSALDLASLGFRLLFKATWLYRKASLPLSEGEDSEVRTIRIRTTNDLAQWERAWSGEPDLAQDEGRIFLPALLSDEDVAFIAVFEGESLVAGAIGNRTGDVVGVSNLFLPARDGERLRAYCVAGVMDAFPSLPLVGYDAGEDAVAMRGLGFEDVGPLRIWALGQVSE